MKGRSGRTVTPLVVVAALCTAPAAVVADPLTITPSIGLAESFTDNVEFNEQDHSDAITRLRLGLAFIYTTESSVTTFNLGASAFYRTRGNEATIDLGEAQRLGLNTTYGYSERLKFYFSDQFGRRGSDTRDLAFINAPFTPDTPDDEDPSGDNPSNVNLILPRDNVFYNSLAITAAYRTSPLWTTTLQYTNGVSSFGEDNDDDGNADGGSDGTDVSQQLSLNVGRQMSEVLTLNGRAAYRYLYSSDAADSDVYSLSAGPTYKPASLWSISALVGGSLNRQVSDNEIRGAANVNISVSRVLENSLLNAGIRNGFTPSAGLGGASRTFTAYAGYNRRLTEFLTGNINFNYSRFDTSDNQFDVLSAQVGFFYPIWRNIGANLNYVYRWRDADEAEEDVFDEPGVVDANVVSLQISWASPLWLLDL